jgi:hypothetical protein
MGHSPSEANSHSANQKLSSFLRYPKIHYNIYKCPSAVAILNQWISIHPYFHFFERPSETLLCQRITSNLYWIKFCLFFLFLPWQRSRYSDWLRAEGLSGRSSSPGSVKNFLFSMSSGPALGLIKPPIQWVRGGALSPGVKRPGRESDHSPPPSAAVKKMWIYTSIPPHAFMVQCLIS